MLRRHAIQVLRDAGHDQVDVARLIGVGVRTVRRVEGEPDVTHIDDAAERPCRATKVIPAVRLEEERSRLRPLKVAPADLAVRVPIVVGPTGAVIHDLHPYSKPPDAMGIAGTL